MGGTPMQLGKQSLKLKKYIFANEEDIAPQLQNVKTIAGIRSHHRFVPLTDCHLLM